MSFTSRMRLAFGVLLAFALLAACATRPPAIVLLDPARQAALLRELPRSEDVLLALANYNAELGQRDQARTYARTLTEIAPGNQAYRQLLQQLQ